MRGVGVMWVWGGGECLLGGWLLVDSGIGGEEGRGAGEEKMGEEGGRGRHIQRKDIDDD